jgi:ribosome biogenesis GTPase / thiamine phosphate phosphatase
MRELALWDGEAGLERSFADIEALAAACRFNDCAHDGEPGCAVTSAIADGDLAASRFDGWRKLEREARHLERRVDALARSEERRKWKAIHKSVGKHMELKYGKEARS